MIPRHRPPFTIRDILWGMVPWWDNQTVEAMEEAWADFVQVPYAVLVPSGRAAICWGLQAAIESDLKVVAPAYTCRVVHEAIALAGASPQFLDVAEDDLLMDRTALRQAQEQPHALVLCELFGCTYDPAQIYPAVLRIFDMAMTVPHPSLFKRLSGNDWGIISFGLGKCLYSGWGGMGFSHDEALVREVRKIRAHNLRAESFKQKFRHNTEVLIRAGSHLRLIYGTMRRLKEAYNKTTGDHEATALDFYSSRGQALSNEYIRPLTSLDRFLGMHNLRLLTKYHEQRIMLAHRYASHFTGNPGVKQIPLPATSISHYIIRVNASQREVIRRLLWRAGIDTAVHFPFPPYLSPEAYPRSQEVGAEILNLPLDHRLSLKEVDYIATKVNESVQICEKMEAAG